MQPILEITQHALTMLQRFSEDWPAEQKPSWKECKARFSSVPEREAVIRECIRALAEQMPAGPYEVLPVPALHTYKGLYATVTDTETGVSLRGRVWIDDLNHWVIGFDVCTKGFVGKVPYVGEWMVR